MLRLILVILVVWFTMVRPILDYINRPYQVEFQQSINPPVFRVSVTFEDPIEHHFWGSHDVGLHGSLTEYNR